MKNLKYIFGLLLIFQVVACKKEWLDEKNNQKLVIPNSVQDCQALLDNGNVMNSGQPANGEVSADNYYVIYSTWQTLTSQTIKNAYIWGTNFYEGESSVDWNNPYQTVFYANVALEAINNIKADPTNVQGADNVKGSALFYRALSFYNMVSLFAKPYNSSTASTDLGIPLKLTADINSKPPRSTVQQTYDQIIRDLKNAIYLVPVTPTAKTRPSRPAAYALLSRVYLSMNDYENSLLYADSCIQLYPTIADYNTLAASDMNTASAYPLKIFNSEVIFHYTITSASILLNTRAIVDSNLYKSFAIDDLRRTAFFKLSGGFNRFRGSYTGALTFFAGLATDEIYLTRAECYARKGMVTEAMKDLNALIQKRWKNTVVYPTITATDKDDAINKILTERRKELMFRGIRWTDLRRLNLDSKLAVTLNRQLDTKMYTLPPNDDKYALPIPDDEIRISNIEQNPR